MLQWAFCTKVGSVTTVMLTFALITCGLCLRDQVPKTRFGARVFSPVVRSCINLTAYNIFLEKMKLYATMNIRGEKNHEGIKSVIGVKGTLYNWQV